MADPITFRPTVEDTENLAILTADPEYQAEIRAVREELDELRAW
jgi:hypothetical protein